MIDLVEIRRLPARDDAERLALVLVSVGIECRILPSGFGVGLCVAAGEAERARRQLGLYERENAVQWPPLAPTRPAAHGIEAALAYVAILLFFFVAQGKAAFFVDWSVAGAAQSALIRAGAWWRTVTALMLHADLGHLIGNLLFGVVFALPVAQLLGSGLGWLAILTAGALGNAVNAFLQTPDHTSIGASTALFAALGILSGYARQARALPWHGRVRRWAPVAAGIMLLTWLGAGGERTDVGAHVAGFAVGGAIGFALARAGDRIPQGPRAQLVYAALTLGMLAVAWLLALRAGPP